MPAGQIIIPPAGPGIGPRPGNAAFLASVRQQMEQLDWPARAKRIITAARKKK